MEVDTLGDLKRRLQFLAQIGYEEAANDCIVAIIHHVNPTATAHIQEHMFVRQHPHFNPVRDRNVGQLVRNRMQEAILLLHDFYRASTYGMNNDGSGDRFFNEAVQVMLNTRQLAVLGFRRLEQLENELEIGRTQTVDAQEEQLQASMPDMADKVED